MALKVIDPEPIIKELADRCLEAKGLECSILGSVIDRLRAAPAVYNAPYWSTEAAYKHGYERGYEAGQKDAVEVVHSQWDTVFYERNGTLASYSHICPVCKYFYKDVRFKGHNYCPNCGAKMDG